MTLLFMVRNQTVTLIDTKVDPRIGSAEYLNLRFKFVSKDWANLRRTVQLSAGEFSEPFILEGDTLAVPTYYTQQSSFDVTLLGDNEGQLVPTNVVTVTLDESNSLWTATPPDPQNSAYIALLNSVGNVDELLTEDKSNVVAAVNELFERPSSEDSEQVQADWSQSDETAPDYVKNRTHYTEVVEDSTEGAVYDIPIALSSSQTQTHNLHIPLKIGQTWTITLAQTFLGGTETREVQQADDGTLCLRYYKSSSTAFLTFTADSVVAATWSDVQYLTGVTLTCVSGASEIVHPLDPKYIPSHTHTYNDVTGVVPIENGGTGETSTGTAMAAMGMGFSSCSSRPQEANKSVSMYRFMLRTGAFVGLRFTNNNIAENLTLNIGGTGAYPIYNVNTKAPAAADDIARGIHLFMFDGFYWFLLNPRNAGVGTSDGVQYVPQELTNEQKAQARENIDAQKKPYVLVFRGGGEFPVQIDEDESTLDDDISEAFDSGRLLAFADDVYFTGRNSGEILNNAEAIQLTNITRDSDSGRFTYSCIGSYSGVNGIKYIIEDTQANGLQAYWEAPSTVTVNVYDEGNGVMASIRPSEFLLFANNGSSVVLMFGQPALSMTMMIEDEDGLPEVWFTGVAHIPDMAPTTVLTAKVRWNGEIETYETPIGGGESEWALLADITTEEDVASITVDVPEGCRELFVKGCGYFVPDGSGYAFLKINNTTPGNNVGSIVEANNVWFFNNNKRTMCCHVQRAGNNLVSNFNIQTFNPPAAGVVRGMQGTSAIGLFEDFGEDSAIETVTLTAQSQFLAGFRFTVWGK